MSVENISLFNSVLDEALERLGKKNLKLKECQYEGCCCRPERHDFYLAFWLWKLTYIPASSLRLIELFISNACAVRATYSFLYVDHGLSQSLRFLPKGSQARGTRLIQCIVLFTKHFKRIYICVSFGCVHMRIFDAHILYIRFC